jgi:anti-sigma regulatory factor (Ser/Thr protein kinase)
VTSSTQQQVPTATGTRDPFVHEALVYHDDASYLSGTMPFIYRALAADQPVLVAVPQANVDLLRTRLGAFADGVIFRDMTAAGRNPGRIIPWVLTAFMDEHAGRPVRIIGEPIWAGRGRDEYALAVMPEAMINVACRGRDATILCPYDASTLGAGVIADAEQTHPIMVAEGHRSPSRRYDPHDAVRRHSRPLPEPPPGATSLFFEATGLAEVREVAARQGEVAGLDRQRIEELLTAINEIATNSVVHGGGSGTLRTWVAEDRVVCEVRDFGWIRDPLAGRLRPEPSSVDGRGLVLAHYLCDLVQTYTCETGTTTRLHMLR